MAVYNACVRELRISAVGGVFYSKYLRKFRSLETHTLALFGSEKCEYLFHPLNFRPGHPQLFSTYEPQSFLWFVWMDEMPGFYLTDRISYTQRISQGS
jgi:hypothetical protein